MLEHDEDINYKHVVPPNECTKMVTPQNPPCLSTKTSISHLTVPIVPHSSEILVDLNEFFTFIKQNHKDSDKKDVPRRNNIRAEVTKYEHGIEKKDSSTYLSVGAILRYCFFHSDDLSICKDIVDEVTKTFINPKANADSVSVTSNKTTFELYKEVANSAEITSIGGHHIKDVNLAESKIDHINVSDNCETIMPESPETKGPPQVNSPTTMAGGTTAGVREVNRPHSGNNAGMPSPRSPVPGGLMNGGTPSPPSATNPSSQQLPPACGARQLSKLKRFLTTLQQFGSDISPEIGERVRTLVLGLVNSHLSIEEFHAKLQEATNFPLRPFVIPFLKANLPLLQRELLHCARMAKQTPQQYLTQNEHVLFNAAPSVSESNDSSTLEMNENGKRQSPDRPRENGLDLHPAKRHQPVSPHSTSRVSPNGMLNLSNGPIRLEDISISRELREREKLERERVERERLERDRERDRHYTPYSFPRPDTGFDSIDRFDDDWRHVDTMLNCIIGMVDKARRALAVLQERSIRDREELSMWMRRHAADNDHDLKKRAADTWSNMRSTDDRIDDVRRRAEEAVQEVKRQAMLELHKAVSAAESKANEMVLSERAKIDRALSEARKQTREELLSTFNHQEESSESCWNCGRKASETCSGCNTARYCGSFCQHKDWENHHHVCGKATMSALSQIRDTPPQTVTSRPSDSTSVTPPHNTPSPSNSVVSAKSTSRSSSPAESRQVEVAH